MSRFIKAVCRNCGEYTAKADISQPAEMIYWRDANGNDLMGWNFDLRSCCGSRANTCIDIIIQEHDDEEVVE